MKKTLLLLTITLFVLTGCVATAKRGMKDNIFFSTQPEVAVKLDPNFEYIDKSKTVHGDNHTDGALYYDIKVNSFTFVDGLTQRASSISFSKVELGYFIDNLNMSIENPIEEGYEEHNGKKYQTAVYALKTKDGSCLLLKRFARLVSANADMVLQVLYAEPLKDTAGQCELWAKKGMLTPDQQERINQLNKNCRDSIEFVDLPVLDD